MRAAELIAAELGVDAADQPGAVARRRGDALRRRHPQGARAARLGAADAARRGHPARGRTGSASGARRIPRRTAPLVAGARAGRDRARLQAAAARVPEPRVIAIYGPTASGKTAVARALARPARRRGRLGRLGGALRRASRPDGGARPTRRGSSASFRSTDDVSVGEYQRLAHAAIDEIVAAGRTPVVVGGTGLYLRAALSSLELPPPPAPGERERWEARLRRARPRASARAARRARSGRRRARPPERPPPRRPRARARRGRRSLAPAEDRLWSDDIAPPDARSSGSSSPLDELDRAHRGARRGDGRARRRRRGAAAWSRPLSRDGAQGARARGVRDAARATRRSTRSSPRPGGSPATSASGCAGSRSPLRSTPPVHRRRSRMRSSRWQAQGNVYLVAEEPLTAERVRAEVGDTDGILEVRGRGDDWLEIAIWNPDGSQAEMSGQRHADRRALARRADRRGAGHRARRPARGDGAHARRTGSSSRTSARSSSASPRRSTASASRRSTSATRTRSSRATRPS